MQRFHISLSVEDFPQSVAEYSERLGCKPVAIVENRYALWKTDLLNFSISKKDGEIPGKLRHVGFEDSAATGMTEETDCNGVMWEHFSPEAQEEEIREKFGVELTQ